jgi:phosphoribosylanthranilate isomerase
MIRVKICGMNDLVNVTGISGLNPDYMGFIFYEGSPRYVGKEPDFRLFRVPSAIKKVGVFVNESINRIFKISAELGIGVIQLHGNESPEFCDYLRLNGETVIKVFNINNDFNFESLNPYLHTCDYFMFDTKSGSYGGSGRKFDWKKLDEYHFDKPFFLSGGIEPEDPELLRSISNKGLFAVDINSRFEISTGIKDIALVKTFINSLKKDGYEL